MTRALYRVRSVTARRQLRWIVWGTGLGALPFVFGYALPFALGYRPRRRVRADGGASRPRAARVRIGDHPLPLDGRRSHHQARAGVRGGDGRDRRDLRDRSRHCRQLVHDRSERYQSGHRVARHDGGRAAGAAGQERDPDRPRSRLLPRSLRLSPRARRLRARPQQRSRSLPSQRATGSSRHRDAARRSHGADAGAGGRRTRRAVRHRRPLRFRRRAAGPGRILRGRDAADLGPHADARRSAVAASPRSGRRRVLARPPGSTTSYRASRRKGRLR